MGFDIHGGGSDLIFPHHENEIAQAEGLAGTEPFARHWLHAGIVQMEAEKMSKSLGNIVLAGDVVAEYGGEPTRYWALSASYRSQVTFGEAALDDARQGYERWRTFLLAARHALRDDMPERPASARRPLDESIHDAYVDRFVAAMDDDFTSAEAYAAIHELVREANRRLEGAQTGSLDDRASLQSLTSAFLELTSVLGFEFDAGRGPSWGLAVGLIEYLLELREGARAEKDFERSDAIRAKLAELGVTVEDTPSRPRWRLDGGE